MTKNYKKEKVAPLNLFYILVVSRVIISLNYAQSVSVGKIKTDLLFSIFLGLLLTLIFSIPAIFAVKNNKNPLSTKWIAPFYAVYFLFLAGINITRFTYFATTKLNPDMVEYFLILMIVIGSTYAAFLGVESISRFTSLVFVILVIGIGFILLFNSTQFSAENFYPIISNSKKDILYNSLIISSNTGEIAMVLGLSYRVNGKCTKPLTLSLLTSFLITFVVFVFVIGVLGDYASLLPFPVYGLSQLAILGDFRRLDALFSIVWIFAIFVKASVHIYCASTCIEKAFQKKKVNHGVSCLVCGTAVFVFGYIEISNFASAWNNISRLIIVIPFFVFSVIIPLLSLTFKKKNFGDELLEKF